jgi:ribonuclease D
LRAAQYLGQDAQRRLLRLLRWRDAYARDNDRPRTWILENDFATTLARDPPPDLATLQRQLDAQPKAPRRLGEAVWLALETPLSDESDAPSPRSDERDKQALRKLQDAVAARSAVLGLPDGVLASRRWLELLLDSRLLDDRPEEGGTLAGDAWPGPLAGWRRAQLEAALLPASPQEATGGTQ